MLYFGYGSNMCFQQMGKRCPESTYVGTGVLEGYKFVYDGYSERRKGAVGNIVPSGADSVYGGLYRLSNSDIRALDKIEGIAIRTYSKMEVSVLHNGEETDAFTYYRKPLDEGKPSMEYRKTVLNGARDCKLPEEYIEKYLK